MATRNHIIKKQILDLTLDSDTGSFALQSRVSEIFKSEILPLLDTYCTKIGGGPDVLRINRLEVDLGVLDEKNLVMGFKKKIHEIFPERLAEALGGHEGGYRFQGDTRERAPFSGEATLVASDFYNHGRAAGEPVITKKTRDFELLEFFIKEGRLPWWVKSDEAPEMAKILVEMMAGEEAKIKKLLAEIAKQPAPLQRIVYTAAGPTLEKLVALFHPGQAKEVYNLSCQLVQTLRRCPLFSGIGPAKLRAEIWAAVLSHAFTSRSPDFDSHTVLEHLVTHLAKAFACDEEAICSYLGKKGKGLLKKTGWYRQRAAGKRRAETGAETGREAADTGTDTGVDAGTDMSADAVADTGTDPESGTGKPRREWISDRTSTYLQQLEAIAKLCGELVLILPEKKKLLASPVTGKEKKSFSGSPAIEELITLLRETGRVIPGIKQVVFNLLKKNAKPDIFLVTPEEMDVEEKKKAGEFTELSGRLYHALAVVLEKKPPGMEDEVLVKIRKIMATIDEVKRTVQASAGPAKTSTKEAGPFTHTEEIYLRNAGLVLLWPYLPAFFSATGLVTRAKEKRRAPKFFNEEARERAVLLLHYLVFGAMEGQEYVMVLNKILCGLAFDKPVYPCLELLTKKEMREAEDFLRAVVENWPVMKNASIPALRGMFLQREGVLFTRDGWRVLRVEEKTHDVLLDRLPWGIGTVKLPWMEELLLVEWRR